MTEGRLRSPIPPVPGGGDQRAGANVRGGFPFARSRLSSAAFSAVAIVIAASADCIGGSFDRAPFAARYAAAGGASVAVAEGASASYANPAGIALSGKLDWYADYGEPAAVARSSETRIALAGRAGFVRAGLSWYRLAGEDVAEDLFAAGVARTLVSGTQGSYIAVGASAVAGRISRSGSPDAQRSGRTRTSADIGIIARPLPVISFGYAVGNVFDEGAEAESARGAWGRSSRWGLAYYWEDIVVLSFARSSTGSETEQHIGFKARAELPLEIMFGLSGGRATGGVGWVGSRIRACVSFATERPSGVTWMISFEGSILGAAEEEIQ